MKLLSAKFNIRNIYLLFTIQFHLICNHTYYFHFECYEYHNFKKCSLYSNILGIQLVCRLKTMWGILQYNEPIKFSVFVYRLAWSRNHKCTVFILYNLMFVYFVHTDMSF